jgi:hypothetical protein
LLDGEAGAEVRLVLAGGDELGAGQDQVAFTGPFLGQTQAVPEFEFGLEEVGLQPVDGIGVEPVSAQVVGGRAGEADLVASAERLVVLAPDRRVGQAGR